MILLDTNVVSEIMRPAPAQSVIDWLDAQVLETLYISTITPAEMMFGVAVLPDSQRKVRLEQSIDKMLSLFEGRILPFDLAAAKLYADLAAQARRAGRGFPTLDGYIAAIAADRGFPVATRDASAFLACGIDAIDPWSDGGS
jgi:hypothetical protein